jgi:hypothetical protein
MFRSGGAEFDTIGGVEDSRRERENFSGAEGIEASPVDALEVYAPSRLTSREPIFTL